jgi:hypothetical protein
MLILAAERYYGYDELTFEQLLDLFEGVDALYSGWCQGNIPTIAEACVTKPLDELGDIFDPMFIAPCASSLIRTVRDDVARASTVAPGHGHWAVCRDFWHRLADEFTLTVATLNYDTLIEQALGLDGRHQGLEPIQGENTWRLHPRSLARHDQHRLFHIHGSIHLGRREYGTDVNRFAYEDSFHELYWHPSPEAAGRTIWGSSSPFSQSGRMLRGLPIVTGLHKPDKLLVEPLASYYLETANQLARSPRVLVVGYGFADSHINVLLGRLNKFHGASRRIAVIDLVDLVLEHGSSERSGMLTMLAKWAEETRLDIGYPHPGQSANGCVRWYWNGLIDVAQHSMDKMVGFLNESRQ